MRKLAKLATGAERSGRGRPRATALALALSLLLATLIGVSSASAQVTGNGLSYGGWTSPPPPSGHDYGPAVMRVGAAGSSVDHYYWCGANSDGKEVIFHRASNYGGTAPNDVALAPNAGFFFRYHVCDPSIVGGSFTYGGTNFAYALYFTADITNNGNNVIGVAFSNDLVHFWADSNWVVFEQVLNAENCVDPISGAHYAPYGAGEQSGLRVLFGAPGAVQLIYNDNSAAGTSTCFPAIAGQACPPNGAVLYSVLSTDGMNFGAPSVVNTAGIPDVRTRGDYALDTHDGANLKYYAALPDTCPRVGTEALGYDIATIPAANITGTSGSWTKLTNISTDDTVSELNHNPGLLRDTNGYMRNELLPSVTVYSGATNPIGWSSSLDLEATDLGWATWTPGKTRIYRRANGTDHYNGKTPIDPPGYHWEGGAGDYWVEPQGGTGRMPLYSCVTGPDAFTSPSSTCEGLYGKVSDGKDPHALIGLQGYTYTSGGAGRAKLYRCYLGGTDHLTTTSSTCEGFGTPEAVDLGYAATGP